MKKIIMLVVLSLFIISAILFSSAQEDIVNIKEIRIEKAQNIRTIGLKKEEILKGDRFKTLANLKEVELKKLAKLDRARLKKYAALNEAQIREKLKNIKVKIVKKGDLFRKRIVAVRKAELAKKNFIAAKKNAVELNKAYKLRKANFLKTIEKLKACEGVDSGECDKLNEGLLQHAKELVINTAKRGIEYLNKIKSKIEESDDTTDEEANEAIEKIDNAIAKLEEAITEAESATTREEIKEAARKVNRIWKGAKHKALRYRARIVQLKVGEIIERSRHLEEKLENVLAKMEEEGIEVDDIDAKVDKFSEKIDEARTKYKESIEKFIEAKELKTDAAEEIEKVKALAEEARRLAKEAHTALKDAHAILMDIIKDIRAAKSGAVDELVETGEEVEVIEDITLEAVAPTLTTAASTGGITATQDVESSGTTTNIPTTAAGGE